MKKANNKPYKTGPYTSRELFERYDGDESKYHYLFKKLERMTEDASIEEFLELAEAINFTSIGVHDTIARLSEHPEIPNMIWLGDGDAFVIKTSYLLHLLLKRNEKYEEQFNTQKLNGSSEKYKKSRNQIDNIVHDISVRRDSISELITEHRYD